MSQENVEVVRRAWEAYMGRDNEAALALYHPKIEADWTASGVPGFGVYRGMEGIQEMFRDWHTAFGEFSNEVEEWIDAGDHVIAMVRQHGRGRLSGVPVEMLEAHVWTIRDGKLWRLRVYPSRSQALEGIGASE